MFKKLRLTFISCRIVKYKMKSDKLWVLAMDGKMRTHAFRESFNDCNNKIEKLNKKFKKLSNK